MGPRSTYKIFAIRTMNTSKRIGNFNDGHGLDGDWFPEALAFTVHNARHEDVTSDAMCVRRVYDFVVRRHSPFLVSKT